MKHKKKIIGLAIAILLVIIGMYPVINNIDFGNSSHGELKVYMISDDPVQSKLLDEFSSKYPKIKINKIVFNNQQEYYTKLSADLLAGNGPDIIFGYSGATERFNKLIESGVLKDLNQLIKKDNNFSLKDYNQVVLACGVYENKRLFIPYDYSVSNYIASKDVLAQNNIQLTGKENLHKCLECIDSYLKNSSVDQRILFSSLPSTSELMTMNKINLIDYKKKKADFNIEDMKSLIQDYKKLYESSINDDLEKKYNYDEAEMVNAGKILFENVHAYPNLLYKIISNSEKKGDSLLYMDSLNNNTATLGAFLAINNNSQNQKEAYNYIKLALSKEFQSKDGVTYNMDIPINNKAKDHLIDEAKSNYNSNDQTIISAGEKINQIIGSVDKCVVNDTTLENLMGEELVAYFQNKQSIEQCIKNMEQKVELYLNE